MNSNSLQSRIQTKRTRKTRTAVTSKAPKTYTDYDREWQNPGLQNFQKTQRDWLQANNSSAKDPITTESWPFRVGDPRKQRKALLSVVERKRQFPNPVPLQYCIETLNASWNDP